MTKHHSILRNKILKGLELTHLHLIKTKKERNFDLVISKEGKVTHIKPKDL